MIQWHTHTHTHTHTHACRRGTVEMAATTLRDMEECGHSEGDLWRKSQVRISEKRAPFFFSFFREGGLRGKAPVEILNKSLRFLFPPLFKELFLKVSGRVPGKRALFLIVYMCLCTEKDASAWFVCMCWCTPEKGASVFPAGLHGEKLYYGADYWIFVPAWRVNRQRIKYYYRLMNICTGIESKQTENTMISLYDNKMQYWILQWK